ncbi:MAG: hypothetical protein IJ870_01570 [Alphaproteobacteria bacterium]|nr:hypothetical protein [Alphaproteobacteria bacterium]
MKNKIFLSFLGATTALSFPCFAGIEASGTCGSECTWTLDSDGNFVASGTGAFESGDANFYNNMENIKHVFIEDGISSISNSAFYSPHHKVEIESYVIPESVTYIGSQALWNSHDSSVQPVISITPNDSLQIDIMAFNSNYTVQCTKDISSCSRVFEEPDDTPSSYTQIASLPTAPNSASIGNNSGEQSQSAQGQSGNTGSDNNTDIGGNEGNIGDESQSGSEISSGETQGGSSNQNADHSEAVTPSSPSHTVKRIYTVKEAEALSKKTGNTFRLRYK